MADFPDAPPNTPNSSTLGGPSFGGAGLNSICRTYADAEYDMQRPADVAVVMPTLLRPTLGDALRSVFAQTFQGRIHIVIGIDRPEAGDEAGEPGRLDLSGIDAACEERPPHCAVSVFYPGYSTSVRHGGLHPALDGGVLRTVLTYLANSRRVAYLDDDNWWLPEHLASMAAALEGHDWAWSLRWFVQPGTRTMMCVDQWESVGPHQGFYARYGGWVDPNSLMIDKFACEPVIRWWSLPPDGEPKGLLADRGVCALLSYKYRGNGTNQATTCYTINPQDGMHGKRLRWMQALLDEMRKAGAKDGAGTA